MTDTATTQPGLGPAGTGRPRPAVRIPLHWSRSAAMVLFGVIIPVAILIVAFGELLGMQGAVVDQMRKPPAGVSIPNQANATGNDYALFAMTYAEASNRQVVVNKQVLKTSVMEIGLAVVSLGIMVIVLGFETGGATLGGTAGGVQLNLQTTSTGVVIFVAGALMAAAGGLLRNDYTTVGTPTFAQVVSSGEDSAATFYTACKTSAGAEYKDCFTQQYEKLHPELAK